MIRNKLILHNIWSIVICSPNKKETLIVEIFACNKERRPRSVPISTIDYSWKLNHYYHFSFFHVTADWKCDWSECSETCGGGTKSCNETCQYANGTPADPGDCSGSANTTTASCNKGECRKLNG